MKKPPYIGVTGFMTPQEVRAALRCFDPASERKLMVGVLASSKTLRGETNKYPNRYPKTVDIEYIFQEHPAALNLIHYSTDEPDGLSEDLLFLPAYCGPHLDGFQVNMCWPEVRGLQRVRRLFKLRHGRKYLIVLQIGRKAMEEVASRPKALADKVADYVKNDAIDDILIDASGGKGLPLDITKAREYLDELASRDLGIGLGVAGGLSAETFRPFAELLDEFPDLSGDAEGKLRDPISDDLDIIKMVAYIKEFQGWCGPLCTSS